MSFFAEHRELSRRYFLQTSAAGLVAAGGKTLSAADNPEQAAQAELQKLVGQLQYLTKSQEFRSVERGNPLPYTLKPEQLQATGMTRESWTLDVVADPESNSQLQSPLSRAAGTALDFPALMKLAKKHAVQFFKTVTCNNIRTPLGTGLWEGVPLREVVWMARPVQNVRRVFFDGCHNKDPKQLFRGSLSIGRVLEDPPGMPPVILCYKLNGNWLTGKRGGPVRMVIPEVYGFKCIKWLNRVVLTNRFNANDTYERGNNDIDSWMKSTAGFLAKPRRAMAGRPIPLTGYAQVGVNGVRQVQVWIHPKDKPLPKDDPYLQQGKWKDVKVLGAPKTFGGGLAADGIGPGVVPAVHGFDPKTGRPRQWPPTYALAHWAGLIPGVPAGRYDLRCRTIDNNGIAQPLPRPFKKSGGCDIERITLVVRG